MACKGGALQNACAEHYSELPTWLVKAKRVLHLAPHVCTREAQHGPGTQNVAAATCDKYHELRKKLAEKKAFKEGDIVDVDSRRGTILCLGTTSLGNDYAKVKWLDTL